VKEVSQIIKKGRKGETRKRPLEKKTPRYRASSAESRYPVPHRETAPWGFQNPRSSRSHGGGGGVVGGVVGLYRTSSVLSFSIRGAQGAVRTEPRIGGPNRTPLTERRSGRGGRRTHRGKEKGDEPSRTGKNTSRKLTLLPGSPIRDGTRRSMWDKRGNF